MKLTIKTLVQFTFTVEIEPDKTVKELKEQIEKDHGNDYPCGAQKLIYNGKILADENKLSEYEFDEKKFIVLMITRAPPAPKQTNPESATKQKSEEKPKPATASTRPPQATTTPAAATITTPSSTAAAAPPPPTATTTATVSSTPAAAATPTTTASGAASRQQQRPGGGGSDTAMGEPQLANRLANLMTQPHFRQMQDLIQQSPHLLSSTIESLAASDPEMYSFISENPDVFVNALNHPPVSGARSTSGQPQQQPQQQQQQQQPQQQAQGRSRGGFQTPARGQPPMVEVQVSEHDKEAIERLKELGFSEYLAVQAYMACDRDEQLAANLLFQMEQ